MDALAVFFGEATLDKDDANKAGDAKALKITCEFDQLPETLIVDTEFPTTLAREYLLSSEGTLVIKKTYNGSLKTPAVSSIMALAIHPTAEGYNDLHTLKKADLAKRAAELSANLDSIDRRANALVRQAIWEQSDDLKLGPASIPLEGDGVKQVWDALQPYLPTFALFKSDRASSDQDVEAQDPLKAAIKEAIKSIEPQLQAIQTHVESEVKKIAEATVKKLHEMDPTIANTLNPIVATGKWDSLFKTSITGDEDIPLNKRGSGVRRLVLLNFFRAKAENRVIERKSQSVIYAIEEPETSQHPRNQRLMLSALRDLAGVNGTQVIITTHTPMLARCLPEEDLRFIERQDDGSRSIAVGSTALLPKIAESLGVLPDHTVKIFICVEGPNDISFLRNVSKILKVEDDNVPDLDQLELDGKLIFVPLGGSTLALWSSRFRKLNRPEFHLCDRDDEPPLAAKYAAHILEVNARDGCKAVATEKREIENYLHHQAVVEAYAQNGVNIALTTPFADFDDVPALVAEAVHALAGGNPWADLSDENRKRKMSKAKTILNNQAVSQMTSARLAETDPNNEIRSWLADIVNMMATIDG